MLNSEAKELNHEAKEVQKGFSKNKITIGQFKEQFVDIKKNRRVVICNRILQQYF